MASSWSAPPWTPYPDTVKKCRRCNRPFAPGSPNQAYCTPTCRIIAVHERALARDLARVADAEAAEAP